MTRNDALLADIACWSLLTYLLYLVGWYPLAIAVGAFALIYNGKNIRTVTRGWLSNRRHRKSAKADSDRDDMYRIAREEVRRGLMDVEDIADERIDRYIRRRRSSTGRS